ncbi:MAG: F0F1 ATP synthase subunit A [Planctomycetales bacterium]|nr:F0F1 ATP synthase subunit A [Planctomycetales bacterium]MCA9169553.1 F0F1 ATP synthase subunit A [Planctomycetales bacterium]
MAHDPLDPAHLIGHVQDSTYFEVPRSLGGKIEIPQFYHGQALVTPKTSMIEPFDLKVTKFMVIEAVAALLVLMIAIPLANKVAGGRVPRGRLWNALESILLFLRDEVARPAIGHHDADKFLPFLWTIFFFVLACNLLGMVPWLGSPTGAIGATGALAFMTFAVVVGAGSKKMGPVGFWKAQVPHMDVPFVLGIFLKPMVFAIEVVGLLIKHFVLAVRLLANMFAGHLVLGVLVAFVAAVAGHAAVQSYFHPLFMGVTAASVFGAAALSLLELFVAFLQAYIFTFLSALFIGMAVHPH